MQEFQQLLRRDILAEDAEGSSHPPGHLRLARPLMDMQEIRICKRPRFWLIPTSRLANRNPDPIFVYMPEAG